MKIKIISVSILSVFLLACASTSTQMSGVWEAPDLNGKSFSKILVLGVADSSVDRNMFEDAMTTSLNAEGAQAVSSYTLLPDSGELSEASVAALVQQNQYDAVLVTTFVAVNAQTHHVSGQSYVVPANYVAGYPSGYFNPGYDGFYMPGYYGYYNNAYTVVHEAGYNYETNTAVLETNLYDAETGKLAWSGRSSTVNPQSAATAIPSMVLAISGELEQDNLIRE